MIITALEYIGSAITSASMFARAFPRYIKLVFKLSIIGSVILLVYTILTHQYGISFLNIQSIIMNAVALYNWRNIKIDEATNART